MTTGSVRTMSDVTTVTDTTTMTATPTPGARPKSPNPIVGGLFSVFLAVGVGTLVVTLWSVLGIQYPLYPPDCFFSGGAQPECLVDYTNQQITYLLTKAGFYVVIATALMALSLRYVRRWVVIADGLLLGSLGLLFWVSYSRWSDESPWFRLAVDAVALGVMLAGAYLRFSRTPGDQARPTPRSSGLAAGQPFPPGGWTTSVLGADDLRFLPPDPTEPLLRTDPTIPAAGGDDLRYLPPDRTEPTTLADAALSDLTAASVVGRFPPDDPTRHAAPAPQTAPLDLAVLEQRLSAVESKLRSLRPVAPDGRSDGPGEGNAETGTVVPGTT